MALAHHDNSDDNDNNNSPMNESEEEDKPLGLPLESTDEDDDDPVMSLAEEHLVLPNDDDTTPRLLPNDDDDDPCRSTSSNSPTAVDQTQSLEERVHELETKLAVLARILQSNKRQSQPHAETARFKPKPQRLMEASTPHLESPIPVLLGRKSYTSSTQPPPIASHFDQNEQNDGSLSLLPPPPPITSSKPSLLEAKLQRQFRKTCSSMDETVVHDNRHHHKLDAQETSSSPTPRDSNLENATPPRQHKRNLSFRLLYASDEEEYEQQQQQKSQSSLPSNSLTLSERLWLGPSILKFQQAAAAAAQQEYSPRRLPNEQVKNKWLDYLNSFQESTPDVDVQMKEFIKVPAGVETVMSFGFFICVDSFLYMITVLPIRFVWSCLLLWLRMWVTLLPTSLLLQTKLSPHYHFHRQHLYQIIQVTILYTIYRYVLLENSIGKLYHWIRGQAMLKLYVLIAIVEVFDRLLSSLGQDCLDSMYWNTVSRPRSGRMLISVAVVWIYASIHSLLLFVHVVTLHVAMNSTDQVLLTLLISSNFAEIKSTVFKKYNKAALFKITASDICERFKLALFLSLDLLLNLCQGMDQAQFLWDCKICGMVASAEILADWIKHAFITKFNFLRARIYPEYALLLAGDVTGIGHEGVHLDHSHAVVKRIGFAQIPTVSVLFRLLSEAAKYAGMTHEEQSWIWTTAMTITVWLSLLAVKLALGGLLYRISMNKLLAAPEYSQQPSPHKKKNQ